MTRLIKPVFPYISLRQYDLRLMVKNHRDTNIGYPLSPLRQLHYELKARDPFYAQSYREDSTNYVLETTDYVFSGSSPCRSLHAFDTAL